MPESDSHARTNRELLKALRTPVARFYPCDLHVHSPGSFDVCLGGRFATLPEALQTSLQPPPNRQLPLPREPADPGTFDRETATRENVTAFLDALILRRNALAAEENISESDNWAAIAITDHNTSHFSAALATHAWEQRSAHRLIVLPGLELDVIFPIDAAGDRCRVHVLCLFAPDTTASDIRLAINEGRSPGTNTWDFGNPIDALDLPGFITKLRSHSRYPTIRIAAHYRLKQRHREGI